LGITVRTWRIFTLRRARMARENVMSTPIFDQLLREMAKRAEPRATQPSGQPPTQPPALPAPSQAPPAESAAHGQEQPTPTPRRRHRAD